jgi:hypothetical protein
VVDWGPPEIPLSKMVSESGHVASRSGTAGPVPGVGDMGTVPTCDKIESTRATSLKDASGSGCFAGPGTGGAAGVGAVHVGGCNMGGSRDGDAGDRSDSSTAGDR